MQLSSVIAALVAIGVAALALITLRDQPAVTTQGDADGELATVSTPGDG
jgi:hypothetical protein